MALRLHHWQRRFLGLGAGLFLTASAGCISSREDKKLPQDPAPLVKSMGAGNTVSTPQSPAYNQLGGYGGGLNQPPTPYSQTAMSSSPPANYQQPPMPQNGGRPALGQPPVGLPANTMSNQASFNQPAPIANPQVMPNNFGGPPVQPGYPIQQSPPGLMLPPAGTQNQNPQAYATPGMPPSVSPAPSQYAPPNTPPAAPQYSNPQSYVAPGMPSNVAYTPPAGPQYQNPQAFTAPGAAAGMAPNVMPQPIAPPPSNSMPGIMVPTNNPSEQQMAPPVNPPPAMPGRPQSNATPGSLPSGPTNAAAPSDPRIGSLLTQVSDSQPAGIADPASNNGPTAKIAAGQPLLSATHPYYNKLDPTAPAQMTTVAATNLGDLSSQ